MSHSRREFLRSAAAAGSLLGLGAQACAVDGAAPAADSAAKPFRISLAEWSLHRALQGGHMDHLAFPSKARVDFGIEGVEYVNSFFKDRARDEAYLAELDRRCKDVGVTSLLIMCDGEGVLGDADDGARAAAVENHRKWLEAAARLGCHSIRVNAGGEGERQEVARRVADSLVQLAGHAEPLGLCVIVENHGGLSSDGAWLAGVMRLADNPRVGTLPDFGNFHLGEGREYDRYQGVEELMPFAKAVSAKSHDFDDAGQCIETDYARMLRIVHAAGYRGWLGVEYEGNALDEDAGIRRTQALIERVQAELS
jgi:sugar phosphate isomerase/epimerase